MLNDMKVVIERKRIIIGENALEYYPYYFDIWNPAVDYRITVRKVLSQWSSALATLNNSRSRVYLPYYLDDETCRFLEAELAGEDVVFTDIEVLADGWAMDLDDLGDYFYSEPEIVGKFVDYHGNEHRDTTEFFGTYKLNEAIKALSDADIIGTSY